MFAAVRPATGDRFALVMPVVSTEAMTVFLDQFSQRLAADEHAVMVLDHAGWHGALDLRVPDNITLVPLPPYYPNSTRSSGYGSTCASGIQSTQR